MVKELATTLGAWRHSRKLNGNRACYNLRCMEAPRSKKLWKETAEVPMEKVEQNAMLNGQEVPTMEA